MEILFGGIAAAVELLIHLLLLPFQIAFGLSGGRRRADAPREAAGKPAPWWAVLLVLAVGLGLVGGGLYWLLSPGAAKEQTRRQCDVLAADWQEALERDGLPDWKTRRLDDCDAWGRPLHLEIDRALLWATVRVTSAGPDGQADTGDDLRASCTFRPDGLKKRLNNWAVRKAGDLLDGGKDAKDARPERP